KFLYCAPHTFYFGDDIPNMIRDAGSLIAHVHVADTYNHKASSGLRYICNPPGAKVTIHQHMDIGQGEVNWDQFFSSLAAIGFDGIMTSCVFAWEERADESYPPHYVLTCRAQSKSVSDLIRPGSAMRRFQASQQASMMARPEANRRPDR